MVKSEALSLSGADGVVVSLPVRVYPDGEILVPFRKALPLDAPRARYNGFKPGRTTLKKGTLRRRGALPLPCDIIFERDVALQLRDGVTMYTDVYRPVSELPAPAIIGWGPYGKQEGGLWWDDLPGRAGISVEKTSQLERFEGPDPAYWVDHGYVVLSPDPRGCYNSEGNIHFAGRQTAEDGYDFIEWAAAQPWCSGKLALSGNSWLAATQWFIAAERPPHLAAIAPWEGWSDAYRDRACRGGIPAPAFNEGLMQTFAGNNLIEDISRMTVNNLLIDAYWSDKIARLERIEIPAYVVASYTNRLHTRGTFAGYRGISSREKWLRVHNTHEWPDYYEYADDLRRFLDRYLKGIDNGWEKTPRVRLSVLDPGGKDIVNRPENEFPLARTQFRKLYLQPDQKLGFEPAVTATHVRYDVESEGQTSFVVRFDRDVELTGYMNLHAWVEAVGSDDMDLVVTVEKLNKDGGVDELAPDWYQRGESRSAGKVVNTVPMVSKASGRLKVSHRELDPKRSTPSEPYLTHKSEQRLSPDEIVLIEVGIWPMGLLYRAGESLRLTIAAATVEDRTPNFGKTEVPVPKDGGTFAPEDEVELAQLGGSNEPTAYQKSIAIATPPSRNKGVHVIHAGGKYDSYLLVPEIPPQEPRRA
jgi:hypothetical protein